MGSSCGLRPGVSLRSFETTMPHLVLLTIFVVFALRKAATRRGFSPTFQVISLGLAIEALSFAAVNWGLALSESGEARNWFSFFAGSGLVAAAICGACFLFAALVSEPSMRTGRLAAVSAGFLVLMTLWTLWISQFPDHNWW